MPAIPFPVIDCPNRRTLSPGVFPIREFKALSGATTRVAFGDRASEAKLSIGYTQLRDADAAKVWRMWYSSMGGFREVALPANAFEGIDPALTSQLPAYLKWYMEGEPEVESTFPGRSSVTVNFVGKLTG